MVSRYEDIKEYNENIETIFSFISSWKFPEDGTIESRTVDKDSYRVSFVRPACGRTHGENVQVQLESYNNGITKVHIVSESIINEFDCGNNRANVESCFNSLEKLKQREELKQTEKKIEQREKKGKIVARIASIIFAVILILGIASCSRSCFSEGGNGNSNDKCAYCHGSGMVNEGFFNLKTCPVCHGSGIPPR